MITTPCLSSVERLCLERPWDLDKNRGVREPLARPICREEGRLPNLGRPQCEWGDRAVTSHWGCQATGPAHFLRLSSRG